MPDVPRVTLRVDGDTEMVKSGFPPRAFTVRFTVVVCVSVPEVPVIVTAAVPTAAVELARNVTRLVDVVGFVPKVAVTPAGRPEVDRLTLPVKPPEGATVIVLFALLPWVTLRLAGEAESEKFGAGAPAGGNTQLLTALENSNWMVYVVPLAVYEPC